MSRTASTLWRRLVLPGHDAAWLEPEPAGRRLHGVAVFAHDGGPAWLASEVTTNEAWVTENARVRGRVGSSPVTIDVARTPAGCWTMNGEAVAGLDDLVDLDFGFTPATNLTLLRRLRLGVGQAAEVSVAWCDGTTGGLERLPQRYERQEADDYWYESPTVGYAARLRFGPDGFAREYPGLWSAVEVKNASAE